MNEKRKFNRTIKLSLFALFIFVFVLFAINIPKTLGIYKESKEIVTNVNITKEVYTITLNNQSATTAGSASIYAKYDQGYYTDDDALNQMTTNANAITVPVRTGYTFDGYYTLANGGVKYIDENGYLTTNASTTQFSANGNLYAHWIKSADNLTVTVNPSSYIYNGNAQTPNVTVKDLLTNLTENTDYTVSVDEDTNVGTSTITITMSNIYNSTTKSYYSGTTTITYTINNARYQLMMEILN